MDLSRISTPLTRDQKVAVCPLATVKAQARILGDDENDLIERYIETAYDFLSGPDGWLGGCCLLVEEWEYYSSGPERSRFELPLRPLYGSAVLSFDYLTSGSYAAIDSGVYGLTPSETYPVLRRMGLSFWPYMGLSDSRAYRVRFQAGFAPINNPSLVPSPIVHGMRLLATHWIRNREEVGTAGNAIAYGLKATAGRYRIGPDHS